MLFSFLSMRLGVPGPGNFLHVRVKIIASMHNKLNHLDLRTTPNEIEIVVF